MNYSDADLWIKLAQTFKRDTFYYDLGYHILSPTAWSQIPKDGRAALERLAKEPITPSDWADYDWRIQLFKRLIASKPALRPSVQEFVPLAEKEKQNANALLKEAVNIGTQRQERRRKGGRSRSRRSRKKMN